MRRRIQHHVANVLFASASIAGLSDASAADRSVDGRAYRATPVYKAAPAYKAPVYREPAYSEPLYKPSVYPPAAFSWTGFYVGGNLGYGWTKGTGTYMSGGASGTYSGSGSAFSGGVQAGYNWQTDAIVWGLEADIQGGAGNGTVTGSAGATTFSGTARVPVFGTARGRIGYAFDRTMLYATGGLGYGRATLNGTVSTTGNFSSSATYTAWTVGGGIEQALWNRWSTKLEYLYGGKPSHVPTPPGTTSVTGSSQAHLLRAGLNYRF